MFLVDITSLTETVKMCLYCLLWNSYVGVCNLGSGYGNSIKVLCVLTLVSSELCLYWVVHDIGHMFLMAMLCINLSQYLSSGWSDEKSEIEMELLLLFVISKAWGKLIRYSRLSSVKTLCGLWYYPMQLCKSLSNSKN